jgi:hypothetical protein
LKKHEKAISLLPLNPPPTIAFGDREKLEGKKPVDKRGKALFNF